MSEIYTLHLQDGNKTCDIDFVTLEYLQRYFPEIDVTKVRVHDILNGKVFFVYNERYECCPISESHEVLKAIRASKKR